MSKPLTDSERKLLESWNKQLEPPVMVKKPDPIFSQVRRILRKLGKLREYGPRV